MAYLYVGFLGQESQNWTLNSVLTTVRSHFGLLTILRPTFEAVFSVSKPRHVAYLYVGFLGQDSQI